MISLDCKLYLMSPFSSEGPSRLRDEDENERLRQSQYMASQACKMQHTYYGRDNFASDVDF